VLCFSCFGLLSCTLKRDDLFLKNFRRPVQKRGLENQLPSLVDHSDRCFPHTTREGLQLCVKTTQYSTQPAAHSQDTNTGRGKGEDGDCERRREDGDLPFPKLKSLYYYWQLIILIYLTEYLSNNKQGKLGMVT
jgi:hypothetical protein